MTKAKPAREGKPLRIGIAPRIYAALGVMTALTIISSSVAWFSYDSVDQTVDDLVGQKMPVVELALELSQAATQSTALAARFSEVSTLQQRATLTGELDTVEARQLELLRRIAEQGKVDKSKPQSAIDDLARQINDINDLTGERLRNAADTTAALAALSKARDGFSAMADFETADAQFNVKMNITSAAQLTGAEFDAALSKVLDKDLSSLQTAQSLQLQISETVGLLREISQVDSTEKLEYAKSRLKAQLGQVRTHAHVAVHRAHRPVQEPVGMAGGFRDFLAPHIGDLIDLGPELGRVGIESGQFLDKGIHLHVELGFLLVIDGDETGSALGRDHRHRIGRRQVQLVLGRRRRSRSHHDLLDGVILR